MAEVDHKPRSRDVTDGLEKAAARGMLRAVGMGDEDWDKPQVGVASSRVDLFSLAIWAIFSPSIGLLW